MKKRGEVVFAIILTLVSLVLILVPTGFQRSIYVNAQGAKTAPSSRSASSARATRGARSRSSLATTRAS